MSSNSIAEGSPKRGGHNEEQGVKACVPQSSYSSWGGQTLNAKLRFQEAVSARGDISQV